jgi:uncharacterized RDD family membrane protein YckC
MASSGSGEYGGFIARFFAFFCDQLIASALLYLVLALMLQIGFFSVGAFVLLAVAVGPVYFAAMQSSSGQATIGKSLLGLKVATVGGDRASFLRNLGREFAKIISAIPLMIGYLMAAFTGRKQALHDMVASTVVLDAGPAKPLKGALVVVVAFIANGAIFGFMLQDPLSKMMQETMGGVMAEMQTGQDGLPTGTVTRPRSAPPVAPKVVATSAPVPQSASATPAAPKAAPEAPKAASTPAPQAAPMAVAAVQSRKPAAVAVQRAAPAAQAAAPEAAEPPAEKPAALPADMPARVTSASAPAPSSAPASSSSANVPPPVERPGAPGPKYNDVMTAVLYRDTAGISELLAFGKWVDKADSRGVTPLMIAVRNGDAASAEVLLQAGADPHRNAAGGESAAKIAVARRDAAMTALLERYSTSKRP